MMKLTRQLLRFPCLAKIITIKPVRVIWPKMNQLVMTVMMMMIMVIMMAMTMTMTMTMKTMTTMMALMKNCDYQFDKRAPAKTINHQGSSDAYHTPRLVIMIIDYHYDDSGCDDQCDEKK